MGNEVLMLPWEKLGFLLTKVCSLFEGHTFEQSRIDREKSVTRASVFSSVKHEHPEQPGWCWETLPDHPELSASCGALPMVRALGLRMPTGSERFFIASFFFFFFPEKLQHEDLD